MMNLPLSRNLGGKKLSINLNIVVTVLEQIKNSQQHSDTQL